jgi:hypothetical protein
VRVVYCQPWSSANLFLLSLYYLTQFESEWTKHLQEKASLFTSVNAVLGTADHGEWNGWIDHAFDVMVSLHTHIPTFDGNPTLRSSLPLIESSRQCHGHPLPTNPQTSQTITQSIADQVYMEGNWEYKCVYMLTTAGIKQDHTDDFDNVVYASATSTIPARMQTSMSGTRLPSLYKNWSID